MKQSGQWAVDPGKQAAHALATYDVATPTPGPRTVYRAFFDFGFDLPSPESTIVVDPETTHFDGSFVHLDGSVSPASLSNNSKGDHTLVVVQLTEPREVRLVTLTAGHTGELWLLRIDKDRPAPKPTVTASLSGNQASSSGFVDVRFAIGLADADLTKGEVSAVTVRGQPTGPRLGLLDPSQAGAEPAFFWPGPKDTGASVHAGALLAAALQSYLADCPGDLSPAVRLVMQSDQPCRFVLTSFATGTSFALDGFAFPSLLESDLLDAEAVATRIRRAADPVSAFLRSTVGEATLLDGLNAAIAGPSLYDEQRFSGVTLGSAAQAALDAGDDLPRLNRLLLQDAYPDAIGAPSAKRVLRYGDGSVADGTVAVRLPPGASVIYATIATQESLRTDRPGDSPLPAPAGERSGVHVASDGTAAVSVTVEQAVTATGIALPLLALAAETEIAAELQEDWLGSPSGKRLASGTVSLAAAGDAVWATLFFDRVVLPSGRVWIVLRAAKGEAVWLAAPGDGGLRVLRTLDHGGPGVELSLPGINPLYKLFSRSGEAAEASAIVLAVGDVPVAAERDGDRATYDITAALQSEAGASDGAGVPLAFTSSVAGTVTVLPPHVEYVV